MRSSRNDSHDAIVHFFGVFRIVHSDQRVIKALIQRLVPLDDVGWSDFEDHKCGKEVGC